MTRAAKTTLLSACANVLVFALLLLALEAATRLGGLRFPALPRAASTDRALWVYDPVKGWFHVPGATGECPLGGPDRGRVRLNSLGLRGGEVSLAKRPGTKRVVVLGDSYVFGVGVDEEHLFTTELQRLLDAEATGRFEVVNMGVSGYSTDQEYLLFRDAGARLAPDLTLLVACDNDFHGNTVDFVYDRYYKPRFSLAVDGWLVTDDAPVPRLSRWQRAKVWLGEESNLWNFARTRTSDRPWMTRLLGAFKVGAARPQAVDSVALTAAIIRRLRSEAEAAGSCLLVADAWHRSEKGPLFHALQAELSKDGIPYVGLRPAFARARRANPDGEWDFPGNPHWNVDAHRVAARAIFDHLRSANFGCPLDAASSAAAPARVARATR